MIPIGDVNPRQRFPYVNYALIAVNILVFLWEFSLTERELFFAFRDYAVVPLVYSRAPFAQESLLDGLRSMFMHGGWLHLGSNMLYLWVFGDNVEDRLGHFLYLLVYLICGYAAVYAQVMVNPNTPIPLVGASGAIAGILGSYIVEYPRARIRSLVILVVFITVIDLPAFLVLGFWFVSQLFSSVASLGPEMMSGGVAFFAHIGGFITGVILMGAYNLVAEPASPVTQTYAGYSDNTPTIITPESGLSPQQAARRQSLIRMLATLGSHPIEIVTPSTSYFGQVIGVSPTSVTLRNMQGQVVNIALNDVVELYY